MNADDADELGNWTSVFVTAAEGGFCNECAEPVLVGAALRMWCPHCREHHAYHYRCGVVMLVDEASRVAVRRLMKQVTAPLN